MADEGRQDKTATRESWKNIKPFEVEFADQHCRNHSINTFKIRVRGAWSVATMANRPEGARDIGAKMSGVPATPGQRLAVIPSKNLAIIYDPLEDDPELMKRINQALRRAGAGSDREPVPKTELTCNPDTLKTLCVELLNKETNGDIIVTKNSIPTREQLAALEGDELHDPWNSNTRKPKYKKDVDAWEMELERNA